MTEDGDTKQNAAFLVAALKTSKLKEGFPGSLVVKNPPDNAGDLSSIPGSGRFNGEGNGNPLQYSCPLGSSLHAIFQARTLEQVATSYSRRIPWTEEPGGLQSMGSQRV